MWILLLQVCSKLLQSSWIGYQLFYGNGPAFNTFLRRYFNNSVVQLPKGGVLTYPRIWRKNRLYEKVIVCECIPVLDKTFAGLRHFHTGAAQGRRMIVNLALPVLDSASPWFTLTVAWRHWTRLKWCKLSGWRTMNTPISSFLYKLKHPHLWVCNSNMMLTLFKNTYLRVTDNFVTLFTIFAQFNLFLRLHCDEIPLAF